MIRPRTRATAQLAALVILVTVSSPAAAQRTMVVYNAEGRSHPHREMSLYDVEVRRFQGEDIEGFAPALSDAQLLYIGQYSGDQARRAIFEVPERAEGVREFLARGGMLFFDYNGLGGGGVEGFFAGLGPAYPGRAQGEYFDITVAGGAGHPILSEPHEISGDLGSAYGGWTGAVDGFTALLDGADDPTRAALLIAEDVAGAGTIVITQAYGIFRDEEGAPKDLFENVISYAFGGLPGPGEAIAVYDPWERREPAANPCYLARAEQAPWHIDSADARLPVVVGEPIGLERRPAIVSIALTLPEGADVDSARAFTWAGYELPCQARVLDEAEGTCEVLTQADLRPYEQKLVYVYFGGQTAEPRSELFSAAQSGDGFEMRNDRLRVVLDPAVPEIRLIAPMGAREGNELANWREIDRGKGNHLRYREEETWEASLTEDGPVRKTVEYAGPDLTVRYSLFPASSTLFYEIESQQSSGVSRFTGWAPGGDGTHDTMWYESEEGLKRALLRTGEFYRPFDDILPYMKEGWLAFEDERGETVGELFDLAQTSRVTPYVHSAHGHTAPVSSRFEDGRMTGAFIAVLGDHSKIREAYVAWKSPPAIALGEAQRPLDVPGPRVPEFGRDFLRMVGGLNWFLGTTTVTEPDELMPRLIRRVLAHGGNYVIGDDRRAEYVEPLLRAGRQARVGVILKPRAFQERDRLCPYAEHDAYVQGASDVAAYGPDGVYLVDEFQFPGTCEACRTGFAEKYGMQIPEKLDFNRLEEPAMHNWMLFKMAVINDLIRAMTAAVREEVPDAFVFHVTSPNNHFRLEGYHDLATHSQWVTTTNSDLYSTGLDHTRYMLAHIRGAQGNDRPVFTVNGCMYDADDIALNLRHHLMYGSNALWYFAFNFSRMYPDAAAANHAGFRMLRDTGLGQVLAQARPLRHTAVLRSREGWMACLKRGDKSGRLLDYESRIRERVLMSNVPTEILFSEHLSMDALGDYRVLIVPSEPVIEPEIAEGIAEWVQQGGTVIAEGEAARNETLANLCGVTVGDRADGPADLAGVAGAFEGITEQVSSAYLQVTGAEGETLATIGGQPAVTVTERGEGRACYVSLLDMPTDMVRPLVVNLGGPPPIVVPAEAERDIEVTGLSDGQRTVVAVYNRHVSELRAVELGVDGLSLPGDVRVIDIERGTTAPLEDMLYAEVRAGEVALHLLATEDRYPMPRPTAQPDVRRIHHSMHPGTQFLRLEPEPERQAELPEKDPERIYVAVLRNLRSPLGGCDLGAQAMVAALRQRDDIAVEWVDDIDAGALSRYEVLIVPNMGTSTPAPNLREGWEAEVRSFVEAGGGALLVHHSVGYMPVSHPVFPEIAEAPDYVAVTAMQVAEDHPVATGQALRDLYPDKAANPAFAVYFEETALSAGDQFQSGFADYIKLKPGPAGTVVVVSQRQENAGGDPTVVAGEVGRGRAVLSGINIGCHTEPGDDGYEYLERLGEAEKALLINSVYWLGAD